MNSSVKYIETHIKVKKTIKAIQTLLFSNYWFLIYVLFIDSHKLTLTVSETIINHCLKERRFTVRKQRHAE